MKRKSLALLAGILCHLSFLCAVGLMAYHFYFGFSDPFYPATDGQGLATNVFLILQFPIIHSLLLSESGRRALTKIVPFGIGGDLSTTTFAFISSLQLIAVFLLWTPTGIILWEPHGVIRAVLGVLFVFSWVFLGKAILDTNLALHSGYLGWGAVIRGEKPYFPPPQCRGTTKYIRNPIYLAFALILISGPVWSLDHVLFASLWGVYCLIGPLFKEQRFKKWYGQRFIAYQDKVPYMFPLIFGDRKKSE
jgi:protein-S-isoprenylcysteine O-methyltransferase Ste14